MHSVKSITQSTGLTAETLRAWERRYGAITPERDSSGHRVYSAEDLLRLRLLRQATVLGYPIRKVAPLTDEQLKDLIGQSETEAVQSRGQQFVDQIVAAARSFRSVDSDQALELSMALLSPSDFVHQVMAPALKEVGQLWHLKELSIAQEHIVSQSARRMMMTAINSFKRNMDGPDIVFATLSKEPHEFGVLMCAFLAASMGLRTHYLGIDTPGEEIARAAIHTRSAAVAVSLVSPSNNKVAAQELRQLIKELPEDTEIWVGGACAADIKTTGEFERCTFLHSLGQFEEQARALRERGSDWIAN